MSKFLLNTYSNEAINSIYQNNINDLKNSIHGENININQVDIQRLENILDHLIDNNIPENKNKSQRIFNVNKKYKHAVDFLNKYS